MYFQLHLLLRDVEGGRRTSRLLTASADSLKHRLDHSTLEEQKRSGVISEMLNHRVPVHLGGISDPFANQATTETSKQLLQVLAAYGYPVALSTKNTHALGRDDVLLLLRSLKHIVLQVSFSTSNAHLAAILEPAAPSPQERMRTISLLSREGFHITARLQPLFPTLTAETTDSLIPQLADAGTKHVIIEFLKLPVESGISQINRMFKLMNWNGYDFYEGKGARRVGREWILPNEYRWEILQPVIESIHDHGMTYGSGDYGLNHMGDTECCCGIDKVVGFSGWFQGNFSHVLRSSKKGYLRFADVERFWTPTGSVRMYLNSNCRDPLCSSILDYLRLKWNRPGTTNAPDAFLGICWRGERDEDGNCVYVRE